MTTERQAALAGRALYALDEAAGWLQAAGLSHAARLVKQARRSTTAGRRRLYQAAAADEEQAR